MSRFRFLSHATLWPRHSSNRIQHSDDIPQSVSSMVSSDGGSLVWPGNPWMDERIRAPWCNQQDPRAISGGGQRSSGTGRPDGHHVGPIGGRHPDGSPRFDQVVRPGGYLWWYVDAISDDDTYGLTIIAFVGSVFSPYYHWAFQKDATTNPENHVSINVALYGRGARRWTMTERGQKSLSRSAQHFQVGPSHLRWTGSCLEIDLDEWSVPIPQKVKGKIRVFPDQLFHYVTPLDTASRHHWGPIGPSGRVEVTLTDPALSWKGHAYLDSNEGTEPITRPFSEWDWSRANLRDKSVAVLYDIREKSGDERVLALRFKPDQTVESFEAPARQTLPKALWRVGRSIRSEGDTPARVRQTLEDTPFYVRSVLESRLLGEEVVSMHETLNIPRLDRLSTRLMLPWKMPRLA